MCTYLSGITDSNGSIIQNFKYLVLRVVIVQVFCHWFTVVEVVVVVVEVVVEVVVVVVIEVVVVVVDVYICKIYM